MNDDAITIRLPDCGPRIVSYTLHGPVDQNSTARNRRISHERRHHESGGDVVSFVLRGIPRSPRQDSGHLRLEKGLFLRQRNMHRVRHFGSSLPVVADPDRAQGFGNAIIFDTRMVIVTSVSPAREHGRVLGINVAGLFLVESSRRSRGES